MIWALYVVLGIVVLWFLICLVIAIYFAWMARVPLEDAVIISKLFGSLLFLPLWYPVKYFLRKRESRKINKYVEGIRNKGGSAESK